MARRSTVAFSEDETVFMAVLVSMLDPEDPTGANGRPWSNKAKALIYKAKSIKQGDRVTFG